MVTANNFILHNLWAQEKKSSCFFRASAPYEDSKEDETREHDGGERGAGGCAWKAWQVNRIGMQKQVWLFRKTE